MCIHTGIYNIYIYIYTFIYIYIYIEVPNGAHLFVYA